MFVTTFPSLDEHVPVSAGLSSFGWAPDGRLYYRDPRRLKLVASSIELEPELRVLKPVEVVELPDTVYRDLHIAPDGRVMVVSTLGERKKLPNQRIQVTIGWVDNRFRDPED